jgi:outer membrane protein OmpA-like peptidoglycan-associated protein
MPRTAFPSGHRAAALRLAAAFGLGALAAASAAAQPASPSVIVDWSALDAAGPAPSSGAPVTLKPPPQRVAVTPPASAPPRRAVGVDPIAVPARPAPEPARPAPSAPPPNATAAAATSAAPALAHLNVVRFPQGRAEIPPEGQELLDTVASQLAANAKLRLQLVAYASGVADDAVAARRLSLARAVQMRSYLIAKGVSSVRMDVRALGNRNESGGPADRVDVMIVDR